MHPHFQAGLVVATHGRHCLVETADGSRRLCHPRGKKNQTVVGDRVWWQPTADEGSVEGIQARRNLLYRQDELRTKSFAANLDQVLVLLAAEPEFSESQLTRALIAAQAQQIAQLVVLNKSDLGPLFARAWERLAPYRAMGTQVLALSLKPEQEQGLDTLQAALQGRTTLVLGPSGAGKSTLINRLVPAAGAQTQDISRALNSGKHTTTATTWYWTDPSKDTALIDSPGFQEFGLHHIQATQLQHLMPDVAVHLGQCKFYNCTHLHEPGCGVQTQIGTGLSEQRYRLYTELHAELSQTRY